MSDHRGGMIELAGIVAGGLIAAHYAPEIVGFVDHLFSGVSNFTKTLYKEPTLAGAMLFIPGAAAGCACVRYTIVSAYRKWDDRRERLKYQAGELNLHSVHKEFHRIIRERDKK